LYILYICVINGFLAPWLSRAAGEALSSSRCISYAPYARLVPVKDNAADKDLHLTCKDSCLNTLLCTQQLGWLVYLFRHRSNSFIFPYCRTRYCLVLFLQTLGQFRFLEFQFSQSPTAIFYLPFQKYNHHHQGCTASL